MTEHQIDLAIRIATLVAVAAMLFAGAKLWKIE